MAIWLYDQLFELFSLGLGQQDWPVLRGRYLLQLV